jgi:hypothetical protein
LDKLNFKLKLKKSFLQVRVLLSALQKISCAEMVKFGKRAFPFDKESETVKLKLFQEVKNSVWSHLKLSIQICRCCGFESRRLSQFTQFFIGA